MGYQDVIDQENAKFESMKELDRQSREQGYLVGRYIQEQVCDGYAYYVIVRQNGSTVKVEHQPIFDGYSVRMIDAMKGIIPTHYARENIAVRDGWEDMAAARK